MKQIWKFPLTITDEQVLQMPFDAELLSIGLQNIGLQNRQLCLWAAIEDSNDLEGRTIKIVGTGHPFSDRDYNYMAFIGTVVAAPFVWHVFEKVKR